MNRTVFGLYLWSIPFSASLEAQPVQSLSAKTVADYLSGLLVWTRDDGLQIHMTTCAVSPQFPGSTRLPSELILYQEQASHRTLEQPYRQRFLKIRNIDSGHVISESFRPQDNQKWVQFCDKPKKERLFRQAELQPSHCTVILKSISKAIKGETAPQGCPSNFRGATAVHNRIILTETGMRTYDKGLNANGQVVWGSRGKPYIFTKQKSAP